MTLKRKNCTANVQFSCTLSMTRWHYDNGKIICSLTQIIEKRTDIKMKVHSFNLKLQKTYRILSNKNIHPKLITENYILLALLLQVKHFNLREISFFFYYCNVTIFSVRESNSQSSTECAPTVICSFTTDSSSQIIRLVKAENLEESIYLLLLIQCSFCCIFFFWLSLSFYNNKGSFSKIHSYK